MNIPAPDNQPHDPTPEIEHMLRSVSRRAAGSVRIGLLPRNGRSERDSADAVARRIGCRPLGSRWTAIERDRVFGVLFHTLTFGLHHTERYLDNHTGNGIGWGFPMLLDDGTRFLTNLQARAKNGADYRCPARLAPTPISGNALDVAIVAISRHEAAIVVIDDSHPLPDDHPYVAHLARLFRPIPPG